MRNTELKVSISIKVLKVLSQKKKIKYVKSYNSNKIKQEKVNLTGDGEYENVQIYTVTYILR